MGWDSKSQKALFGATKDAKMVQTSFISLRLFLHNHFLHNYTNGFNNRQSLITVIEMYKMPW